MSSKSRTDYSSEEKVSIIKQHLVEKTSISDLCEKYGLHPNVFYRWQKEFFENAAFAFQGKKDKTSTKLEKRVKDLEDNLARKN